MELTRTHRILIGVVVAGAVVIAAIGFAGSYSAVRALALQKGFGNFSLVFPIGIDAGICVLLALDLLLTWMRIPFPLLRQTAWLLTAATIAFNGAAAWPDPLGVGMHAVIPILFVVTVEAARHAVGRIADITADRHMEGVRITRWLLSPVPTFKLWRRMKLWELRSYEQAVGMEQDRLIYQARLQARYGRAWRRKAPVEALMPLRLARIGVPLSQTAPQGLAAAGLEPVLLRATAPEDSHEVTLERDDTNAPVAAALPGVPDQLLPTGGELVREVPGAEDTEDADSESGEPAELTRDGLLEAYRSLATATGAIPGLEVFSRHLADAYGVRAPGGEPMSAQEVAELLGPLPDISDVAGGRLADGPASPADGPAIEFMADGHPTRPVADQASATPHPFFAPRVEPEPVAAAAPPAVPRPVSADSSTGGSSVPRQQGRDVADAATAAAQAPLWEASATDAGTAARLPEQQASDDDGLSETDRQVRLVADWLDEAEAEGEKLAGAEVSRRLGVSPRTGQRRLNSAIKYRDERQHKSVRAHLRAVSSPSR
ncbi:DUF2637 domain-containing protein [Streptomyces xanthophaeus]